MSCRPAPRRDRAPCAPPDRPAAAPAGRRRHPGPTRRRRRSRAGARPDRAGRAAGFPSAIRSPPSDAARISGASPGFRVRSSGGSARCARRIAASAASPQTDRSASSSHAGGPASGVASQSAAPPSATRRPTALARPARCLLPGSSRTSRTALSTAAWGGVAASRMSATITRNKSRTGAGGVRSRKPASSASIRPRCRSTAVARPCARARSGGASRASGPFGVADLVGEAALARQHARQQGRRARAARPGPARSTPDAAAPGDGDGAGPDRGGPVTGKRLERTDAVLDIRMGREEVVHARAGQGIDDEHRGAEAGLRSALGSSSRPA